MRIRNLGVAAALTVAALGLSACAQSINTQVSRYQAMPAPQGQTFTVVPIGGMATTGGLEFQRYAGMVAQQLQARGYQPAADGQSANMIVQLGYSLDHGQVRVEQDPFYRSHFGFGGHGYSSFYYPRYGRFGFGSPFYYGWDDPFLYGSGGIDSWVEYQSQVDLHIRAAGTNQPLFDGRAQARSATNRLDVLVPNLVQALFTGFPGQSGETVKITIPVRPRA
jgi:hypothetical protein